MAIFGRGSGDEDRGGISCNYYHTASQQKYIGNGNAGRIYFEDGSIVFSNTGSTANSAGADAALTLYNRLQITAAGKVSIGELATPDSLLHIHNGTAGSIAATSYANLTIESSDTTANTLQFLSPATAAQQIRFGDAADNGAGWIQYNHANNSLAFGANGPERVRINSSGSVGIGTNNPSKILDVLAVDGVTQAYIEKQTTTNDASVVALTLSARSSGAAAADFGPALGFQHAFSGTNYAGCQIASECGSDTNTASIVMYPRNYGYTAAARIRHDGKVGIATDNVTFGQSTPISSHAPMVGVQGSVTLASLSTSSTTRAQLQFYRRPGAAGQPMSSHTMGDIAWYGSSNDSDNANMAWSLGCTGTGGSWTSGSNRTASMIGTNHDGEMWRFSEYGVFVGRAVVDRDQTSGQGQWANSGTWVTVVDLSGWPTQTLYMACGAMQYLSAYTATFWVYKTRQSVYQVVYDKDSLCHWRMDGSNLQIVQNSGADQTNTTGYQKVFQICGMK